MSRLLSRRNFVMGAAGSVTTIALSSIRSSATVYHLRQFHNQPPSSPLHQALVKMWAAVQTETNGRVIVATFAENDGIPGSDPQALDMLVAGELDFFTLMGGILSKVVPAAEIQGLPFVFKDLPQVFSVMDGELGTFLQKEMAAQKIYGFPSGCFDNGFRQIGTLSKPIRSVDDLSGLKIRLPDSPLFVDLFTALGADPKIINVAQLYESLKSGSVEAQENALPVMDLFKLYEVQKYLSLSNHMWSGFNLIANLKIWNTIPLNLQSIIQHNVKKYVLLQRRAQFQMSETSAKHLASRGMVVNQVDQESFRRRLNAFYARWKANFGSTAWNLLEAQVGKIG